jgi:asparagine synthase (glutamine-hydrolysing)
VTSLRANSSRSERAALYTPDFAARVQDHDPYEPLLPAAAGGEISIERLFSAGEDRVFGDLLLHKTDVASMTAGLECRSPFLDVALSDYAATLPLEHLVHGTSGKYILRRILAKHVGGAISRRRKMGFTPPVDEWLRGPLAPLVRDLILGPSAEVRAFVERRRVEHLFAEHCARRADNKRVLWALLLLEVWLRRLKVPIEVAPSSGRARRDGGAPGGLRSPAQSG